MSARTPATSFRTLAKQMPPLPTEEGQLLGERVGTVEQVKQVMPKLSVGETSKPVLGLPLARWIPQDVHSLMDYASGLVMASCALAAKDDETAQIASTALAAGVIGVSALTDYKLSAVKLVPIEAHEVIDHVWALGAIAAPFALGYWKTSPKIALMHVMAGVTACVASLVTDYRAYSKRTPR